jgi:hypothetical protein
VSFHGLTVKKSISGWPEAVDKAKGEAEAAFIDLEVASDWAGWEPASQGDEPPWITAARQSAKSVVMVEMKYIANFTEDRAELNLLIDLAIEFAANEAYGFTEPYAHKVPVGSRYAGDTAPRALAADIAALVLKDRAKLLAAAARQRAGLPGVVAEGVSATVQSEGGMATNVAQENARAPFPRSVASATARAKVFAYIRRKGLTITDFAGHAQTTPRTVGTFLKTGKARISTLNGMAKAMSTTTEELLQASEAE